MKTILCIGAHPDDIEFGAGAILLKEKKLGHAIKLLVLSKGEAASNGTPEEREKEAISAAQLLGAEIQFLDMGGDSHINRDNRNAITIAKQIRELKPDIIISPLPWENQHPDHSVVGKLTRDACRLARYGGLEELKELSPHKTDTLLFFPSTPNLDKRPDIIFDVSNEVEEWKKLMNLHESQHKTRNYSDLLLAMAVTWGMSIGVDHAWGLYKNDPLVLNSVSDIIRTTTNL